MHTYTHELYMAYLFKTSVRECIILLKNREGQGREKREKKGNEVSKQKKRKIKILKLKKKYLKIIKKHNCSIYSETA